MEKGPRPCIRGSECMFVHVCVREKGRKREREMRTGPRPYVKGSECVCERKKQREREIERERDEWSRERVGLVWFKLVLGRDTRAPAL